MKEEVDAIIKQNHHRRRRRRPRHWRCRHLELATMCVYHRYFGVGNHFVVVVLAVGVVVV